MSGAWGWMGKRKRSRQLPRRSFPVEKGGGTSPSLGTLPWQNVSVQLCNPPPLPAQSQGMDISVPVAPMIARINCIHFVMPADIHITWTQFISPVVFPSRACGSKVCVLGRRGGGAQGLTWSLYQASDPGPLLECKTSSKFPPVST